MHRSLGHRAAAACFTILALMGAASIASAATSPPGVNLRWDQCFADNGAFNKNFACDTNSGAERLVGSFEIDAPLSDVSGMEFTLDLGSVSAAYPAWWQFKNAGTCRQTSMSMNFVPLGGVSNCADWSAGNATGGIGAYASSGSANRFRITSAVAVPAAATASLSPGQEYFAFNLTVTHLKTVGTGACGGCLEPMCIFFSGVRIYARSTGAVVADLTRGANYAGSQYVTWQQAYPLNIGHTCGGLSGGIGICQFQMTNFDCVLATPTESRGSTWGQVKSLYR